MARLDEDVDAAWGAWWSRYPERFDEGAAQRYPMLSSSEEAEAIEAVHAGYRAHEERDATPNGPRSRELRRAMRRGEAAEVKLFHSHLRLVMALARRWARVGVPLDEARQQGAVALFECAWRVPIGWPHRFATYARPRINTAIARSKHLRLGQVPMSARTAQALQRSGRVPPTFVPIDDVDIPDAAGDAAMKIVERAAVGDAISMLPPFDALLVELRWYSDLSRSETASALGCSTEWVRRREGQALKTLRELLEPQRLGESASSPDAASSPVGLPVAT